MKIEQFTRLLEYTLETTRKALDAGLSLARPSRELAELYGPMTSKLMKDKSIVKAQQLYDRYHCDHRFNLLVTQLGDKVSSTSLQATNGGTSSMTALIHLKDTFGPNLQKVLDEVKAPKPIDGILVAVADLSITIGLSFIPVVGPFLAIASTGVSGAMNSALYLGIKNAPESSDLANTLAAVAAGRSAQESGTAAEKVISKQGQIGQIIKARAHGQDARVLKAIENNVVQEDNILSEILAQKGVASLGSGPINLD